MAAAQGPFSNESIVMQLNIQSLSRVARINGAASNALPHLNEIRRMLENAGDHALQLRFLCEAAIANCVGIIDAYKAFCTSFNAIAFVLLLFQKVDRACHAFNSTQSLSKSIGEHPKHFASPDENEMSLRCKEVVRMMEEVVENRTFLEGLLG